MTACHVRLGGGAVGGEAANCSSSLLFRLRIVIPKRSEEPASSLLDRHFQQSDEPAFYPLVHM
jgi:hypothetical protein